MTKQTAGSLFLLACTAIATASASIGFGSLGAALALHFVCQPSPSAAIDSFRRPCRPDVPVRWSRERGVYCDPSSR